MPAFTSLPPREVFKLLLSPDNLTPEKVPYSSVISAAKDHPRPFETMLRKVYYRTLDQQFKRPKLGLIGKAVTYFEDLRGKIDTPAFIFFEASLYLTSTAMESGLAKSIEPKFIKRAVTAVTSAFEAKYTDRPDCPERLALNVLLGQLHSTLDRNSAARYFTEVRESGYFNLVPKFYWDSGAATYFGSKDLKSSELRVSASKIVDSLQVLRTCQSENKTTISVSVDENFFRIYIAWFIFYAQQLPEIDFIITICSDAPTAKELIGDADDFASSMARLNRSSIPSNLGYLLAPTPKFAASERTFYACARFFTIPLLLRTYTHVYLVDADLHFESDPSTFLKSVRDVAFGAPTNQGLISLPPWRRNMAGNIVANQSILGTPFLHELLSYIVRGLSERSSWMLDQNAITYAVEVAGDGTASDLSEFRRPTIASKFMSTWERNYFANRAVASSK